MKTKPSKVKKAAKAGNKVKEKKSAKGSGPRGGPGRTGTAPTLAAAHPLSGRVWTLEIGRERIVPSPTNPRKDFPEEMLAARGESLRKQGQLVALIVRPHPECLAKRLKSLRGRVDHQIEKHEKKELAVVEVLAGQAVLAGTGPSDDEVKEVLQAAWMEFEIADGECRWRASGKKFGDLKALKCDVRILSGEEMTEIQWSSWLQRENLSPLDEAQGLAALRAQGWSIGKICERFDKSESYVHEKLKLTRAEGPVRQALQAGRISPSVASVVASVPGKAAQKQILEELVFEHGSEQARPVRDIAADIEENFIRPLLWWDLHDSFEHAHFVSLTCAACPKMTRNMTDENPQLAKGPARCMGLECHAVRFKCASDRVRNKCRPGAFWPIEQFHEIRYSNDHAVEGETCYGGGEASGKKWEVIAKGSEPFGLAMAPDGVRKVWLKRVLIADGLLKAPKGRDDGDEYDQQQKAAMHRLEAEVDRRVATAVVSEVEEMARDKVATNQKGEELLRLLAHGLLSAQWHDSAVKMAKRRGADKEEMRKPKFVEKFGIAESIGVLTEGLLLNGLRFNSNNLANDVAKLLGVDVAKVEAEVKAEVKEKKAAKKKGAQKEMELA